MLRFSTTTPIKKVINGRTYKLKKWSTVTTSLESMKLAKVIAPSFSMVADLWMGKSQDQEELENIHKEVTDNLYVMTGAVSQLCAAIEDEHFLDLSDKLLSGLQIIIEDEAVSIDDWSAHFDEYPEDFDQVLIWSVKENIWDFFMKKAMFASKIEMLKQLLAPMQQILKDQTEKNTN